MRVIRAATPNDARVLGTMLAAHIAEHQAHFPKTYPWFEPQAAAAHYSADWRRRLRSARESCKPAKSAVWRAIWPDLCGKAQRGDSKST